MAELISDDLGGVARISKIEFHIGSLKADQKSAAGWAEQSIGCPILLVAQNEISIFFISFQFLFQIGMITLLNVGKTISSKYYMAP